MPASNAISSGLKRMAEQKNTPIEKICSSHGCRQLDNLSLKTEAELLEDAELKLDLLAHRQHSARKDFEKVSGEPPVQKSMVGHVSVVAEAAVAGRQAGRGVLV